jgi:hypothetical protein
MHTIELTTPTVEELTAPVTTLTMGYCLITPEMAVAILKDFHASNRTVSKASADAYLSDMVAGRWRPFANVLSFTADGKLSDGQHRMFAVASGKGKIDGVPFLIVKGGDLADQEVMDSGRKRTVADQLNIGHEGDDKLGTKIVAAMRALYIISGIEAKGSMGGGKLTNSQLFAMIRKHPKLVDSVRLVNKGGEAGNKLSVRPAVVAAIHYATQHILKGVKGKGDAFVSALVNVKPTEGYTGNDPAWQLATVWNTLESRKHISENDAIKLVTLAWSAYAEGATVQAKSFRHGMVAAEAVGITREMVTGEAPAAPAEVPAEAPKDAPVAGKKAAKGKTPAKGAKAPTAKPAAKDDAPKTFKPNSAGKIVQTEGPTPEPKLTAGQNAALAYLMKNQKDGDPVITMDMIDARVAEELEARGPQTV